MIDAPKSSFDSSLSRGFHSVLSKVRELMKELGSREFLIRDPNTNSLLIMAALEAVLPIVIAKEGKWYVATCPILDIATQGRTEKEVKENMSDLLNEYSEILIRESLP